MVLSEKIYTFGCTSRCKRFCKQGDRSFRYNIANYNKSVSFYERIVQIIYENEDMVERTALGKLRYVNSFKE